MSNLGRPILLNQAAASFLLSGPDQADQRWLDCKQLGLLERLESPELRRLGPMLYPRVLELGESEEVLDQLRALLADCWEGNCRNAPQYRSALKALHSAGVSSLLVKGAALIAGGYADAAERFMHDIDVVVSQAQLGTAISVLEANGWQGDEAIVPELLEFRHATTFHHKLGGAIDLHWHTLLEAPRPDIAELFAQHSIQATYLDQPVRILTPTAHLFYVCVHGARTPWDLYWLIDAANILQKQPPDWDQLLCLAERCQVSNVLCTALREIDQSTAFAVPTSVLVDSSNIKRSAAERYEQYAANHRNGLLGGLPYRLAHWRRIEANPWTWPGLLRLFRLLKFQWKLQTWGQLPPTAVGVAWRVIRRSASKLPR